MNTSNVDDISPILLDSRLSLYRWVCSILSLRCLGTFFFCSGFWSLWFWLTRMHLLEFFKLISMIFKGSNLFRHVNWYELSYIQDIFLIFNFSSLNLHQFRAICGPLIMKTIADLMQQLRFNDEPEVHLMYWATLHIFRRIFWIVPMNLIYHHHNTM